MEDEKKEKKELKIYIHAEIEGQFRRHAMEKYGYAKGSISQAAEDALEHWNSCVSPVSNISKIKDPVAAIEGMLAHVKKTSIELQHEASKIRAERALHYLKKRKGEK